MTTLDTPTDAVVAEAASLENAGTRRRSRAALGPFRPHLLERLAGVTFIAAPLLHVAGMATSPVQTEPGEAGYIASLAADPALSIASASFLHYGWVLFAIAAVAGRGLLRGKRGSVWLPIAAVMLLIGAIQMSGLLLSDWFLISAGNVLPMDQAVLMDETAKSGAMVALWQFSGLIGGLIGLMVYSLGLARAGVVPWWIAPFGGLAWFVTMAVTGPLAVVLVAIFFAPFYIAGFRLITKR
ncbi:MAG: hypothetical protein DI534_06590 [Leifsonia xyli]|nr:MAG: hypothetical protein DI534_06590 [Leifsonia xyli]